jgi:thiamine pyrophosphokinase
MTGGGRRVVIFAGGQKENPEFYRETLRAGDILLCADSGAMEALKIGVVPDAVIGDFDSFVAEFPEEWKKTLIMRYPREKDRTDLDLALEHALGLSPDEVLILGGLGLRPDHALANMALLVRGVERGLPVRIVSREAEVRLVGKGRYRITGEAGEIVSLIPLSERVGGIELEGFRYGMKNGILDFGSTMGMSNELVSGEGLVSVGSGLLLLIRLTERGAAVG